MEAAKLGLGEKMPVFEGVSSNRRELEADEELIMDHESLEVHPLVQSFFAKRKEAKKRGGDSKQARMMLERARRTSVLMVVESVLHQLELGDTLVMTEVREKEKEKEKEKDKDTVRGEERFFRISKNRKQLEWGMVEDRSRLLSTAITETLPINNIIFIERGVVNENKKRTSVVSQLSLNVDTFTFTLHLKPDNVLGLERVELTAQDDPSFSLWYDGLRALTIGTGEIFECPQTLHESNQVYLTVALQEELHLIEEEVATYQPVVPPLPATFDFAVSSEKGVGGDVVILPKKRRTTRIGADALKLMKTKPAERVSILRAPSHHSEGESDGE